MLKRIFRIICEEFINIMFKKYADIVSQLRNLKILEDIFVVMYFLLIIFPLVMHFSFLFNESFFIVDLSSFIRIPLNFF